MVSSTTSTWSLPPYDGPYKVGTRLEEHSIPSHERISVPYCPVTRTLKFRIFYPTASDEGTQTFEHPCWASPEQIRGFANFAGIKGLSVLLNPALSYMLAHIRIPAAVGAPLIQASEMTALPVVLFSHGLGGTDTSYSTICGNLASYGMVVFAIEHRDHSASSTIISEEGFAIEEVEYISPVDQSNPQLKRRAHYMLKQRNLELRMLLRQIGRINLARGRNDAFKGRLDLDNISLAGHSFGAATCLHLLDSQNNSEYLDLLDLNGDFIDTSKLSIETTFKAAVLLDIWTQPLEESLSIKGIPILNLVSDEFSRWPSNHDRLLSFIEASKPLDDRADEKRVMTNYPMECQVIKESLHLSQSDGGLLYPTLVRLASGRKRSELAIMKENVERTIDFFVRHGSLKHVQISITGDDAIEKHKIQSSSSLLPSWMPTWNSVTL